MNNTEKNFQASAELDAAQLELEKKIQDAGALLTGDCVLALAKRRISGEILKHDEMAVIIALARQTERSALVTQRALNLLSMIRQRVSLMPGLASDPGWILREQQAVELFKRLDKIIKLERQVNNSGEPNKPH